MEKLIRSAIGLATLILAASYALSGGWAWVAGILLVGVFWLSEPWHGHRWASTVGLVVLTTLSALGAVWEFPPLWLLTCLVALLVAWDLSYFAHYLDNVTEIRHQDAYINTHLRRLALVAGLGWLLAAVALNVQLTFGLIAALVLGLLLMMSLSRAVRYMRRESD